MSKRDEYVLKMKNQLDEWNAEVAKWEGKAGELQAEARTEYEKGLNTAREQRDNVMQQLNQVQSAAGEAWVEMARGADDAWARMREAFDKANARIHKK